MDRSYLDRLTAANSERVLISLTQQQYLHPARTVFEVARTICEKQGFSDLVGDCALRELAVDEQMSVGRLSRRQLRALANSMETAWQVRLASQIRVPMRQYA